MMIGTVGRLVPVKGFDLFLEVAREVVTQADQVSFSVLGAGPLKGYLQRRARTLGLEHRVTFEPPRVDLAEYYTSLDLYLNTSVSEGLPLSILEAMAHGKPVVAPMVGGIPEVIRHGREGLLAAERCTERLAGLCLQLIQDSDLRIHLGRNAAARVQARFTSTRMAASYARMYRELIRPRPT
jgi:glycosyltransferase involved in cell wall biosynthesis